MNHIKKILLALVVCLFSVGSIAQVGQDRMPIEDQTEEFTVEENFINGNIVISDWFDSVADGIDLFIVRKRVTRKKNETSVKLSNNTYVSQLGSISNSPAIGVNLRLPNVEEYWNLKFTSYDDTKDKGVRNNQLRTTPQENNAGATVGLFKKLGDVRTAFQPRIELRDPLNVSHSLSFESIAEFKTYLVNPKLEFYATPNKGTGIFHAINFNLHLSKKYSMTFVNEGDYIDKSHVHAVTNGLALSHSVTRSAGISYGGYIGSNNQTNYHIESYTLAISWGHVLYKKILDYSITLQLGFEKTNNFLGVPSSSFGVSLNF